MPYKTKEARNAQQRRWRPLHPEISQRWRANHSEQNRMIQLEDSAHRRYGLSRTQQVELHRKACEICAQHAKKMCIDHVTQGTWRGVLCQQCNTRLGWFERRKEQIIAYLEKPCQR